MKKGTNKMKETIIILLLITTTLFSSENYSKDYQPCLDKSGGVTLEMRICNGKELKFQDKLLNKYYKEAMQVLDKVHKKELKKVQRIWIKYRDAKCDFLFGLTGGSMDLIIGGGCYVDMTMHRARELKSISDTI